MRSFDSITPIILAAGNSARMGYPKALLPIGNNTFLTHILGMAKDLNLATPIVILGRAAVTIQPTIQGWPASIKINMDPDRGQLSSIQLGLTSLDASIQACMVWPVDQPAVSRNLVRRLANLYIQSQCLMAFPKFGEKRGHPAIFDRTLFSELLETPPQGGAKGIILHHLQSIAELPTDESAVVYDIDTPSDYESLTGESLGKALARGILKPDPGLGNR